MIGPLAPEVSGEPTLYSFGPLPEGNGPNSLNFRRATPCRAGEGDAPRILRLREPEDRGRRQGARSVVAVAEAEGQGRSCLPTPQR